jgi:hypothetical protein
VPAGSPEVEACVEQASSRRLSGGREPGDEQSAPHFHEGVVGDWVNHFDDEALAAFHDAASSLLAELGDTDAAALPTHS